MKCRRQITKICWQDHIRNSEVAARTGLGPVSDLITRHRNSVFGHIARLPEDTPAHQTLRCHVDLTLGHLPDQIWKCRPGHPNNRWIDQLCRDNNSMPPADLWRRSTTRGHSGVMLRSSMTTRWRQRCFTNLYTDGCCVYWQISATKRLKKWGLSYWGVFTCVKDFCQNLFPMMSSQKQWRKRLM